MKRTAKYFDSTQPITNRISDLLCKMTLPEKLGQMLQLDGTHGDLQHAVMDLHVGSLLHIQNERATQAIAMANKTRLKIPLLLADDCIHGHGFMRGATVFPTQLAMACSWNPELVRQAARITAIEATCTGLKWTFSPVLGVARDLRWGRVGETFGEDLLLASELGEAMIYGYQGSGLGDKDALLATAKHYAGYCETQGGRDASEADLSQRKLRSWFFPSFERAAQSGCMAFMTGYQAIDGVPSTACSWLLKDVLRKEWGFKGVLVTDWDNVGRMHWEQQICNNMKEAAALAVRSGNDIMMATPSFINGALDAVQEGLLNENEIDEIVERILALKFKMGLFEDPGLPDLEKQVAHIGCAPHRAANLALARQTPVLLQNDGILPLNLASVRQVAVIGPNADDPHAQLGDWAGASGQVSWLMDGHPRENITTVLDGLRLYESESMSVKYEKGADIVELDMDKYGYFNTGIFELGQTKMGEYNQAMVDNAEKLAVESDVVVAVVGDNFALAGENCSTATLEMQGGQIPLLERLCSLSKKLVVVVISTKPLVLPKCIHCCAAIIQAFNPGMEGGRAIAEILFGDVNPSGRLPISIPYHVGQQPIYYNQVRGQHGDRYADLTQRPHFPFGFGLSYANVFCENLQIESEMLSRQESLKCSVEVANSSSQKTAETVQLYVRDKVTSATWATKELKGFQKIQLEENERRTIYFEVSVENFSIVTARGKREVEAGEFELLVGFCSDEHRLQKATFWVTD